MIKNKPNFLGIGSVRSGSTWLHALLNSHPDFYFPSKRKEIQFFTRHYNKGENWYRNHFKFSEVAPKFQGEFTPGYLTCLKAPKRIKALQTVEKFVLILRNPISRTYSQYKWHLRVTGQKIDFMTFCRLSPKLAIENGMYFKYLSKYLKYFKEDSFLILIFEEATSNPEKTLQELGSFFGVDENLFVVPEIKNKGDIPKHRKLFVLAHKIAQFLRKIDLDYIPNFLIDNGLKNLFGNEPKNSIPKLAISEKSIFIQFIKTILTN